MERAAWAVLAVAAAVVGLASAPGAASAENEVTTIPINDEISVQKTITPMYVPPGNTHPWGSVSGQFPGQVEGYPVIIQFHQGGEPVHVAQVDADGSGSYEYRFRAGAVTQDAGGFESFFEGHYDVIIFRVVPNEDLRA